MERYKLMVELPFLGKGSKFDFDYNTGQIFAVLGERLAKYPLREGLSGYLWLLKTERKYLRRVKS